MTMFDPDSLSVILERQPVLMPEDGEYKIMTVRNFFYSNGRAYLPVIHQPSGTLETFVKIEFDIAASINSQGYVMWRGNKYLKRCSMTGDELLLVYGIDMEGALGD